MKFIKKLFGKDEVVKNTSSTNDERLISKERFNSWLSEQWAHFKEIGPLKIKPSKKTHCKGELDGVEKDFYAAVYSANDFSNYMEFAFYELHICSLFQSIVRDSQPDMENFFPESIRAVQRDSFDTWSNPNHVIRGNDLSTRIGAYELPSQLGWLKSITPIEGTEWEEGFSIRTSDGYVTLLIVDG